MGDYIFLVSLPRRRKFSKTSISLLPEISFLASEISSIKYLVPCKRPPPSYPQPPFFLKGDAIMPAIEKKISLVPPLDIPFSLDMK